MLSVIVITYNPGQSLQNCFASIPEGSTGLNVEVIVVDNASTDDTVEQVHLAHPEFRLICNDYNSGFAAGVDDGLAAARGEYILLLNPDVTLGSRSLTHMVAFLDTYPEVGIIGARSRNAEHKIALTAYGPFKPVTLIWQYLGLDRVFPYIVFGRHRHACETATEPFEVSWVQGSCMMFRRKVANQIGDFDKGFFLYAEETDFCTRAIEAGWQIAYVPQAEVIHDESSTTSRYPYLKSLHYHLSPLYYFRKRQREAAVVFLKIGFTLEISIKSVIRIIQWIMNQDHESIERLQVYQKVLREVWIY